MQSVYLDNFKLHDLSDSTAKFFISPPIKGLEFPAIRSTTFPRAGEDGIFISTLYIGERRITLNGVMSNLLNQADYVIQRQAFFATCSPIRDQNNLPITRILRFTALDGNTYQVQCQVIKALMPMEQISYAKWSLDLLASSVSIENYNATTTSVSPYVGGGVILPDILPVIFSAGSGGIISTINNGNANAFPIITLNGLLTNPRIENSTLGKFFYLSLSIPLGASVVIDMQNRTVVQGLVTNQISSKSSDSKFWWLQSGANTIKLTTSSGADTGNASIVYRDSYSGI